jgi:hypothetical protein
LHCTQPLNDRVALSPLAWEAVDADFIGGQQRRLVGFLMWCQGDKVGIRGLAGNGLGEIKL